jgi:protein transport protein YIF1
VGSDPLISWARKLISFDSVILTLFAGMLNFGSTIYGLVFLYAFFANAFFLVSLRLSSSSHADLIRLVIPKLRSLRSVVLPDALNSPANVGTVNPSQRKKRITFLFLEAVSQIIYMGVLVRV